MGEKSEIVADAGAEPLHPGTTDQTARDLDQAFWFVQESSIENNACRTSASDLKALRHKIDLHIVPIVFGCYTMQFIGKSVAQRKPFCHSPCSSELISK